MTEADRIKFERLLLATPSYKSAPPIRVDDDGYTSVIEKWKHAYGGDATKLVIENKTAEISVAQTTAEDDVSKMHGDKGETELIIPNKGSTNVALTRDYVVSSPSNPQTRVRSGSQNDAILRAEDDIQPNPPVRAIRSVKSDSVFRDPPPPPQRPYTVEWIVSTPTRARYDPLTGAIEAETITPVPEFADSHQSLPSLPKGETSPDWSAERTRNERGAYSVIGQSIPSGNPESVSRILLMLDEVDGRKSVKHNFRSGLARIHKHFTLETITLMKTLEARLREEESNRQALLHELSGLPQRESETRQFLRDDEHAQITAILELVEKETPPSLTQLRLVVGVREALVLDEAQQRHALYGEERRVIEQTRTHGELEIAEAVRRTKSRIERKLNEIRMGDPIEQRGRVEFEESHHRLELKRTEQEAVGRLASWMWSERPMLAEELRHRRKSLGFCDDLIHDEKRIADDEEMSVAPPTEPSSSSSSSASAPNINDEASCKSSRSSSDSHRWGGFSSVVSSAGHTIRTEVSGRDRVECEQYLEEMHRSLTTREEKAKSGYNRNGWRFTEDQPDPLLFTGVKDGSGKLLGSCSPKVKDVVRQFLTPAQRSAQRGDPTPRASSLPPNVVMARRAEEPRVVVTDEDAEDMMGILKNIRQKKRFTWPKHTSSVRDRPAFPQDSEFDIYRREPGPNMGTEKRYLDVISGDIK